MNYRECEVILDVTRDYDGEEIEVTCGRPAVARVHDWWMCAACRDDAVATASNACGSDAQRDEPPTSTVRPVAPYRRDGRGSDLGAATRGGGRRSHEG